MLQNLPLGAYDQYIQEVRHTPQLTDDEESRLLLRLVSGVDAQQARDRLVAGYQPLIISLAKRFARRSQSMELLDLVQEGNVALLQAFGKYDASKSESSFRTFAFAWIRAAMLTALWQYEGSIRLPLHKVRAMRQMGMVNTRLLLLLGREPTLQESAQEMGVSEKDVRELVILRERQIVSLHMPLDEDGETFLEDVLADADASAFADEDVSWLEDVLKPLTELERAILLLRCGFGENHPHTQKEVARVLGMKLPKVQMLDRRARIRLQKAYACQSA